MKEIQKIIEGQEEIVSYFQAITSTNCFEQKAKNALELLKILDSALEFLADSGFDNPCDVLISDDGWCNEHCTLHGQTEDCWLRYFSKISKDGEQE